MPLNATEFVSTVPMFGENFSLLLDWYWAEFNSNWSSSAEVKQSMSKTILMKLSEMKSFIIITTYYFPTNTVGVFFLQADIKSLQDWRNKVL